MSKDRISITRIYLILFAFINFTMVLNESSFRQVPSADSTLKILKALFLLLELVLFILNSFVIEKSYRTKPLLLLLMLLGALFAFMAVYGTDISTLTLFLIILNAKNVPLDKIFRIFLATFFLGVLFVIACCLAGILPDLVNERYSADFLARLILRSAHYTRHSFGFLSSNQIPFELMAFYIIYLAWRGPKTSWFFHLFIQVVNIFVFALCGARFIFLLVLLSFAVFVLLRILYGKHGKRKGSGIRPGNWIFFFCGLLSVASVVLYRHIPRKLDELVNFRITYAYEALKHYGVQVLGSGFTAGTLNDPETMGYMVVDNGYLFLLLQRGILFFLLILLLWTLATHTAGKGKNPYLYFAFLEVALVNLIDSHLTSYRFLPLLLVLLHDKDPLLTGEKRRKTSGER